MTNKVEQDAQFVAQLDADATREKLAEIYANAFMGACESSAVPYDAVSEDYDAFIEQVCDSYPKFEEILISPNVPTEEKLRMLDDVCSGVEPVFKSFLKTLARRGRMDFLREIRTACRKIDDTKKGRVQVRVTTATPLSETTKNRLAASLRELVHGEPVFIVTVDPNLIGGITVRVGDVVYDASIATQLKKVRQDMVNRSAHEIQSRRNCFSHPEGN